MIASRCSTVIKSMPPLAALTLAHSGPQDDDDDDADDEHGSYFGPEAGLEEVSNMQTSRQVASRLDRGLEKKTKTKTRLFRSSVIFLQDKKL